MKVNIASSIKTDVGSAVDELREKIGDWEYDFILFSINPKYDWNRFVSVFRKEFETENFFGFHSLDSFENTMVVDGIVLCAIKFERKGKVALSNFTSLEGKVVREAADYLNSNQRSLHLFIPSMDNKIGDFLEELSKNLSYPFVDNILGGVSSGYMVGGEYITYRLSSEGVFRKGISILTFENVDFTYEISLGFKPYGALYTVSKAEGNRLYMVDEETDFAEVLESMLRRFPNKDIHYLYYTPLLLLDEEDGQVTTMRTPMEIGKGYVELAGPIKDGTSFKLSFANYEEILEEDRKSAMRLIERFGKPEFAINFSCTARQYVLEDQMHREQEIYVSFLNAPIFGFFTYGEIAPNRNRSKIKLYNETSVLLAMRER